MRNTSKNRIALEWARLNLPPEQYNAIKKSFDATTTRTLIFVLCCIPIMLAFLSLVFIAPFSSSSIPKDASYSKTARVDYDGNFYWTHNSKKYEEALEDYDLNPKDFYPNDILIVYLDDDQNVIEVVPNEEGLSTRDIEIIAGSIGAIVVPVILITCIYMPIAFATFGKPWRRFIRAYNGR